MKNYDPTKIYTLQELKELNTCSYKETRAKKIWFCFELSVFVAIGLMTFFVILLLTLNLLHLEGYIDVDRVLKNITL